MMWAFWSSLWVCVSYYSDFAGLASRSLQRMRIRMHKWTHQKQKLDFQWKLWASYKWQGWDSYEQFWVWLISFCLDYWMIFANLAIEMMCCCLCKARGLKWIVRGSFHSILSSTINYSKGLKISVNVVHNPCYIWDLLLRRMHILPSETCSCHQVYTCAVIQGILWSRMTHPMLVSCC